MSTAYSPGEEFHLKIKKGDIGRYVILPGDPGRCESIASYFENPEFVSSNREYTIYNGMLEGERVSVCSTGIGGPSAAIALEECMHCGADTFIRIGTSGGMDPEVLGGDLVIATASIRMSGTANEYAPIEFPAAASHDVVNALETAAIKLDHRYHVGVVHCKDNFYGQHNPEDMPVYYDLKNKWDAWVKCGTLASEMESATLFVVASIRKARIGTILTVLGNQTRREMGLPDVQVHDTKIAVETAVQALRILIMKDQIFDR